MIDVKKNPVYQYIHFHSSEYVYVFYRIDNELYVKILKDNNEFSNKKISDNVMEFAVEIDEFGIFHLVCLAMNGELVYWKNQELKWYHRILTKYDSSFYQFKGLKIFLCHQKIHILLAVANELNPEQWILKHHYWNNTVWHNKKVCEMNCGKYDNPFQGDIDTNDHIHIVYKSRQNEKNQIFYSKFNMAHNMWSTPQKINISTQENNHPFIFCDHENRLHLVWSCLENGSYKILYRHHQNSSAIKSVWSEVTNLTSEDSNCTHPLLLQRNDELKILWRQNNDYYIGSLNSKESTINAPILLSTDPDRKLFLISVIGSKYKLYQSVKLTLGYGFARDKDIYILGLDDIQNDSAFLSDRHLYHEPSSSENPNLDEERSIRNGSGDNFPSKATSRISPRMLLSTGSQKDKSQVLVQNEIQTFSDLSIKTIFESNSIKDTRQDLMIKISEIEERLENIYSQLTFLTEKIEEIEPILFSLNQQGFQLKEDMTTMRSEKMGLFRWFK